MNDASEHDIDRVLTALRDTEPSTSLEARILQALENRTPVRSAWFRWTSPMPWGIAALATAAIIIAVAHTTHTPPNAAISAGTQASPSVISTEASRLHPTRSGEIAPFTQADAAPRLNATHLHTQSTNPPHELLCDCDPVAMAEMQAPSHLAPEMPLTTQERLLQRLVHRGDLIEIAELEPLSDRPAPAAKEDDAVKNVVRGFLKQLAAAEAINPTAPVSEPDPLPDLSVDSPSNPN